MSGIDYLCRNYVTVVLGLITIVVSLFFRKLSNFKYKTMITLIILTIILSILTYVEFWLGNKTNFTELTIRWRIVLSSLCYVIRPTIIYVIILLNSKHHKEAWVFSIPWFINFILYFISLFTNIVFSIDENNHFYRGPLSYTCTIVSTIYLVILLLYTMWIYRKSNVNLYVFLILTFILCTIGIILDAQSGEYSILCNIIMVCIFAYLLFSIFEGKSKQEKEIYENLAEQKRLLMLSQIQPHFMYNTLNTIHYLCTSDPKLASKAVLDFSHYLRKNMDSIDKKGPVPIEDEISHAKAYVEIEMLRFDNISVEFDIKAKNFKVPALTVQPLVENAIKHGVRDLDDGKVKIRTYEAEGSYYVEVWDNGVGFNLDEYKKDGKNHIGLKNVTERIEMSGLGKVRIDSQEGKGTRIVIKYDKRGQL